MLTTSSTLEPSEKVAVFPLSQGCGKRKNVLKSFHALHETMEAVLPHADEVHVTSIARDQMRAFVDRKLSNPRVRVAVLAVTKGRVAKV